MNVSLPTGAQLSAFGRHVVSYGAGVATVAVGIHFLNPDQGTQLATALKQLVDGLTTTVGAVSTLVAIGSGLYASWTASPVSQIKAVAANPDVSKVVATPQVANSIPSGKVVAQ
jgi:hypothetical protein